jgi:hypothetical protein
MYGERANVGSTLLQMDQLADRLPRRAVRCGPRCLPDLRTACKFPSLGHRLLSHYGQYVARFNYN